MTGISNTFEDYIADLAGDEPGLYVRKSFAKYIEVGNTDMIKKIKSEMYRYYNTHGRVAQIGETLPEQLNFVCWLLHIPNMFGLKVVKIEMNEKFDNLLLIYVRFMYDNIEHTFELPIDCNLDQCENDDAVYDYFIRWIVDCYIEVLFDQREPGPVTLERLCMKKLYTHFSARVKIIDAAPTCFMQLLLRENMKSPYAMRNYGITVHRFLLLL